MFALVLLSLTACGSDRPPPDDHSPVRAIDHVYVPTAQAREVAALLRASLGLPEVWPFASGGGTARAGFSLSNVVLEVLERADAEEVGIEGVAFVAETARSGPPWLQGTRGDPAAANGSAPRRSPR